MQATKKAILATCFSFLALVAVQAQQANFDGYWQGIGRQAPINLNFRYGLSLTQKDSLVSGTSTIVTINFTPTGFAQKKLIGRVSQKILNYLDTLLLPQSSQGFDWCIVNSTNLKIDSTGNKMTGTLQGIGVDLRLPCTTIDIELYRLKLLSDSCASGLTTIQLLGNNIKWYNDSLSNTPIFQGNNYQVNMTRDTKFWVTQTNSGIESPKYPIAVMYSVGNPNCRRTAVKDFNLENFTIFPTPTESQIHINLANVQKGISQLTITDIVGRDLLIKRFDTAQVTVDVSNLSTGLYFAIIETEGGKRGIRKFIKN